MPKKKNIGDGEMLAWLQASFSELKKLNLANEKRLEKHQKRLDKTDGRILKLLQALQSDRKKQDERWQKNYDHINTMLQVLYRVVEPKSRPG